MIKDLDELTSFLKLCRKQGVKEIKFGECSVIFGDLPKKPSKEEEQEIQTDEPSMDQLIYLSAGGQ